MDLAFVTPKSFLEDKRTFCGSRHLNWGRNRMVSISRKQLLVVLGMHRSGTSLVAGILSQCGVNFGDNLMMATVDNPKGYFEDLELVQINSRILNRFGSHWSDARPVNFGLIGNLRSFNYRYRILRFLRNSFKEHDLFGVKDPRLCRLLPFWERFFDAYDGRYVITFRSPFEVAESLKNRDGMTLHQGLKLWASYNLDILERTRDKKRIVLSFKTVVEKPELLISALSSHFGLVLDDKEITEKDFRDKTLYRSKSELEFSDIEDSALRRDCTCIFEELEKAESGLIHSLV